MKAPKPARSKRLFVMAGNFVISTSTSLCTVEQIMAVQRSVTVELRLRIVASGAVFLDILCAERPTSKPLTVPEHSVKWPSTTCSSLLL